MFAYRYLAGVAQESTEPILLRIAEEVDLSHSLLARIVLERHLSHSCFDGENRESVVSGFNTGGGGVLPYITYTGVCRPTGS